MHQELHVTAHSNSPLAELGASSLVPAHIFFKRQALASRAQFKLGSKRDKNTWDGYTLTRNFETLFIQPQKINSTKVRMSTSWCTC